MTLDIPPVKCTRCGCSIPPGKTRYIVSISVVADFDGYIPEPVGEGELDRVMKEIESKTREELENEVYQQMSFIVCKKCRDEFVSRPWPEITWPEVTWPEVS